MKSSTILGIDVGGSGIKGAIVDLTTGTLSTERYRIPTPQPASPDAVAQTINQIVSHFEYSGPIGCGFPSAIQQGIVRTASNIDKSWIGVNASTIFSSVTRCPVNVINDADAAAMAEMRYGAGLSNKGVTLLITVGTGLGTAIFSNGSLVPNTELGHIILPGQAQIAERFASDAARKRAGLSWAEWGKRFNEYLQYLYPLFYPDLVIIGGGASKKFKKYGEYLAIPTQVVPALLQNGAGIVGAALAAEVREKLPTD